MKPTAALALAVLIVSGCASDGDDPLPGDDDDDQAVDEFDPASLVGSTFILRDLIRGMVIQPPNVALDHFIFDIGVPQPGFTVTEANGDRLSADAGLLDDKDRLIDAPLPISIEEFRIDPNGYFSLALHGEYAFWAEIVFPLPIVEIRIEGVFAPDGSGFDRGVFTGRVDPRTATAMGYNDFCSLMPQVCDVDGMIPLRIEDLQGERVDDLSFPPTPLVCLVETACPESVQPIGEISCAGKTYLPEPNGESVDWEGVVYDFQTGAPVGDANLSIPALGLQTTTLPDGSYRLEGLPVGQRVDVSIAAAGYKETWIYLVGVKPEDSVQDFDVVSNSVRNLVPAPCGIAGCPPVTLLSGAVADCDGQPLGGYGIRLVSHGETEKCDETSSVLWFHGDFPNHSQCPASDDGLYGIIDPTPGKVWVDVLGEDQRVLVREGPIEIRNETVGLLMIEIR